MPVRGPKAEPCRCHCKIASPEPDFPALTPLLPRCPPTFCSSRPSQDFWRLELRPRHGMASSEPVLMCVHLCAGVCLHVCVYVLGNGAGAWVCVCLCLCLTPCRSGQRRARIERRTLGEWTWGREGWEPPRQCCVYTSAGHLPLAWLLAMPVHR